MTHCAQDAFHRFEPDLSTRGARSRLRFRDAGTCSGTLVARRDEALLVKDEPPRRASPRSFRFASRRPVRCEDKMLLTDFCNRLTTRAPVDRPTLEREAFAVAVR